MGQRTVVWETPSSVAFGDTFPLEGEGCCADFLCFCFEILISERQKHSF